MSHLGAISGHLSRTCRFVAALPDVYRRMGVRPVLRDGRETLRWVRDAYSTRTVGSQPGDLDAFGKAELLGGAAQIREEIESFCDAVRQHEPRRACEIGTAAGGTNLLLGQLLPSLTHLLGVDLFVRHRVQLYRYARPDLQLDFFDASSYDPRTVQQVSDRLGSHQLDLLFIDGDHTYEGARADFLAYRHLVRDGGIIAFHDIQDDGRANGIVTLAYSGGVPDLWREMRGLYPSREFIVDKEQLGFGIGMLTYDSTVALPPSLT